MVKIVELGEGISNGRVWDVRLAKRRRKWDGGIGKKKTTSVVEGYWTSEVDRPQAKRREEDDPTVENTLVTDEDDKPVLVCRPKVGMLTMGGGFVGLWRKVDHTKMEVG